MSVAAPLLLGSTSVYRRQLLERLHLPFSVDRPDVDESVLPAEAAEAYVQRLAIAKARVVAERHPGALVIGSDQACVCAGRILGKPGTQVRAAEQLRAASGQRVLFLTAVCLHRGADRLQRVWTVPTEARFRRLSEAEIARYLAAEAVLDSAGAFKSEGLGISLLEAMRGDDPTALIGLPLISLAAALRELGYAVP
jgi:septum formation protein